MPQTFLLLLNFEMYFEIYFEIYLEAEDRNP